MMKPLLVLLLLLLAGCSFRYDIVLSNGSQITAMGRPKLDARGYYTFKDATGRELRIHQAQIRSLEPHEEKADKDKFTPAPR